MLRISVEMYRCGIEVQADIAASQQNVILAMQRDSQHKENPLEVHQKPGQKLWIPLTSLLKKHKKMDLGCHIGRFRINVMPKMSHRPANNLLPPTTTNRYLAHLILQDLSLQAQTMLNQLDHPLNQELLQLQD